MACICEKRFSPSLAPCPDGHEGCLVGHYNAESFICPKCGKNHYADS
jgi:hypothetical protein